MDNRFARCELMLGEEAVLKLKNKRVAVFGVGGVGGYIVEALARCGVGAIDLIDNDTVNITNINRQIIAKSDTVGMLKTDAAEKRCLEINPEIKITKHNLFFLPENSGEIDFKSFDYVADAIDTVSAKVELAVICDREKIPLISCMGTGNKLCPEKFEVADIYKTSVCPLARAMRTKLKSLGIKKLKVVYSKEEPVKSFCTDGEKRGTPGSVSFVPPVAGFIMAGEIIKDLAGDIK